MPITQEQKNTLKDYIETKSNPTMALFKALQAIWKWNEEHFKEFKFEIEVNMKVGVEEIKQFVEENICSLIDEAIKKRVDENIFKGITQIKGDVGDKGDKGDFIRGDKGDFIKGDDGITPIAGKDYPTTKQIEVIIKRKISMIKIELPKDGKTPIMGKDFLTPLEMNKIIENIQTPILGKLDIKIKELDALLKRISDKERFGGRTLHRGGGGDNEPLAGTKDGVNKVFTVVRTPKFITFQGQAIYLGSGYSGAGKVITLDVAPNSEDIIRSHF